VCVNIKYIILSFFSDSLAISVCNISVGFKSVFVLFIDETTAAADVEMVIERLIDRLID